MIAMTIGTKTSTTSGSWAAWARLAQYTWAHSPNGPHAQDDEQEGMPFVDV